MNKAVAMVAVFGAMVLAAGMGHADPSEQLRERIAPVGSVCMAGDDCAGGASATAAADSDEPRSGEQIHEAHCATCHAAGVAGAPRTGNAEDWAPLLEREVESLYTNAIEGIGGMPPMGMCNDCSEEEIHATVDYMIEQVQ